MTSIGTNGIAYRIGVKTILQNITFSLEDGDRLGIVGVNGSGKSTLLKIISGEYAPDEGDVFIAKNKTVGILHQDDAFNIIPSAGDSVLEQMYSAFPELLSDEINLASLEEALKIESNPEAITNLTRELETVNSRFISRGGLYFKSRCKSMLLSLGFDEKYHSLPILSMSGGQRTRIALARLLAREPDILLLDEPTNHLDMDTMIWLENHLSSYKKTLIIISHDRMFLDKITNKTLDVENQTAKLYSCPYSKFVGEKERERAAAEKKYEMQQKEIARLEAFIANQRKWNRERNIIAAESREKAIQRMEKVERPPDAPRSVSFTIQSSGSSGNDILEVKKLSMGFPGNILFSDLNFLMKKNERLFITGPNGCGKSTLIKVLLSQVPPSAGSFSFGYNVKIGYYAQDNQQLTPENTVLDEIWNSYPGLTQTEIRNTLAIFMFRGDDVQKKVAVLSGGERARLTLAKLILSKMNLLILDEPTNHLDIESREALETALENFDGSLIAVSHDRYFVRRLANRFIGLSKTRCTDFHGNYDEFISYSSNSSEPAGSELSKNAGACNQKSEGSVSEPGSVSNASNKDHVSSKGLSGKEEYLRRKAEAQLIKKTERRLDAIAKETEQLEFELIDIDDELYGEAASDYIRASELTDRKITVEDRLMQLYEEEEEQKIVLEAHRDISGIS